MNTDQILKRLDESDRSGTFLTDRATRLKLNAVVRAAVWFFESTENLHEHGFSGLVVAVDADGTNRGADHAGAEEAFRAALEALLPTEATE